MRNLVPRWMLYLQTIPLKITQSSLCLPCHTLLINSAAICPSTCPLLPLQGRLFCIKTPSYKRFDHRKTAGAADEKRHSSNTLLAWWNDSTQLVSPPTLSPLRGHLAGEIWWSVVNTEAIRHYLASPFREMKKVQTNRGPDVSCVWLIEFLSTYAPGWHGNNQTHRYRVCRVMEISSSVAFPFHTRRPKLGDNWKNMHTFRFFISDFTI